MRRFPGLTLPAAMAVFAVAVGCGAFTLVDPSGNPVAGARVTVAHTSGTDALASLLPFLQRAVSDDRGSVSVPLPAAAVILVVDHPDFAPLVLRLRDGKPRDPLVLTRGRIWSGRVTIGGTREARGGRLCVAATMPVGPWEQTFSRCTTLDERGRFELAGLPPPPFEAKVHAPEAIPGMFRVADLSEATLDLKAGIPVTGSIRDARGEVPPHATIEWEGTEISAGPDGSFAFGVASLPARLTIRCAGYEAQQISVEDLDPLAIVLESGERVSAEVFTEDGPFTGSVAVWLDWSLEGGGVHGTSQRVDVERGHLAVELPGPGSFKVRIEAPQYEPLDAGLHSVAKKQDVFIGPVYLRRGGGFRGRFVDAATGEPLAGVLAEALPVGPATYAAVRQGRTFAAVSADDGELVLAGLPLGRYLLRVQREGRAPRFCVHDVTGDVIDLGLVSLDEGVRLSGVIRDRAGTPRPGLRVALFDAAREFIDPLVVTTTDGQGRFGLPACSAGRYRLEVRGNRTLWAQELELDQDRSIQLAVGGAKVFGRVAPWDPRDDGGTVVATSRLDPDRVKPKLSLQTPAGPLTYGFSSFRATVNVRPDGRFEMDDVPVGPLVFHVVRRGTVARLVTIPDAERAEVLLDLSGEDLAGTVVDSRGAPVIATVKVLADPTLSMALCRTDSRGWFQMEGLPEGRWRLVVTSEGYVPRSESVELPLSEPLPPLVLTDGRAGTVRVLLHRHDGSSVGGVPVILDNGSVTDAQARIALMGGPVQFTGLAAGTYAVLWNDPLAGVGVTPDIDLHAGAALEVEPDLGVGSSVTVACPAQRCGGDAIEELVVTDSSGTDVTPLLTAPSMGLRMSDEGDLSLGRLAAGKYSLVLRVGGERWEKTVEVAAGEPTRVVLF